MRNAAAASIATLFVLAGVLGGAACWPLAPSGGTLPDASAGPSSSSGGPATEAGKGPEASTSSDSGDASTSGEGGTNADAGEAGDAADATVPFSPPSSTVATGSGFGCFINTQGNVLCWGANGFGQAGGALGTATVATPQIVSGVANATSIALGDRHACAVTASHAVYCWGLNDAYQLGHVPASAGDLICPGTAVGQTVACTPTPALVSTPAAVAIAAAGAWTCAVGVDATVQCWGAVQPLPATAPTGTLPCGLGPQATGGTCYAAPYAVAGLSGVVELAVAFDHACAVIGQNQLACWGNNNEGQVSPLACPQSTCTAPLTSALTGNAGIIAGNEFSCAVGTDNGVRCFGDNTLGQLGHAPGTEGDTNPDAGAGVFNTAPTAVAGLGGVNALVGAPNAACALVSGSVECWGQVAGAASVGASVTIAGLPTMVALGPIGGTYACGKASDASTWCWDLVSGNPTKVN